LLLASTKKDTYRPSAGLASIKILGITQEVHRFAVSQEKIDFTQLVFATTASVCAFTVPIPVLLEPTR